MRDKRKGLAPIAEVISGAAGRLKIKEGLLLAGVWKIWREVAGEAVFGHARPARWLKGTLYVRAESSAWLQELSFFKAEITERLKKTLPGLPIKAVAFEMGEMPPLPSAGGGYPPAFKRPLTDEDQKLIEDAVGPIRDADVKRAARAAMATGLARRP